MQLFRLLSGIALVAAVTACKVRGPVAELRSVDGESPLASALADDQKTPLAAEALEGAPAELRKAAAATPLDAAEAKALLTAFRSAFKDCRFAGIETTVFRGAKVAVRAQAIAAFKAELAAFKDQGFSRVAASPASPRWSEFAGLVQEMDCLGLGLGDIWPGARSPKHRYYLQTADEARTLEKFFTSVAWTPKAAAIPETDAAAVNLRNTTNGFEFIDYVDIIVNFVPDAPMIHPRQNRPVWQIYDYDAVSNIDGWREAAKAAAEKEAPELKLFYGIISRRKDAFVYREQRVVGGGDLEPSAACAAAGAKTWLGNTKFFRASRRQVEVLRSNPIVATQWCEDGGSDPDAGMIAQYEYPSAYTYAHPAPAATSAAYGSQPARFAAFLSSGLRAELDAAKASGFLEAEFSLESTALTRKIITELVAYILKDWAASKNPASYPYQLLMSTHPSDDYNGRSLRAWYKAYESRRSAAVAPAGVPLFLTDFNLDLYTSPEEFFETALVSARLWARMMASYTGAAATGRKIPDVAFPWAVTADCESTSKPDEVVEKIRAWMRTEDHLNLIRTKQKFDVDKGLKAAVAGLCDD